MNHMSSYSKFIFLLFTFVLSNAQAQAQKRLPIIDMHMHARTANHYGPPPQPMCAPAERMPLWDQTEPWGDALEKSKPCKNPIWSPKTDAEVMGQTVAVMKKHNIIGMLGGKPELVSKWMAAAPGRFIPGLDFRLDRATGTATAVGDGSKYTPLSPEEIGALYQKGAFKVFGEVLNQYAGIAPDDERMEPYWALAEKLDIPVGIHIGGGGPGEVYLGNSKFRARMQSALTLEEVLVRHPRLRVYIMHAGYPMLDDLLALLFNYPQVYVDVSVIVNVEPRASFYRYLKGIVDGGYGERVMFGSDQMVWAGVIEPAIESIERAPFLTRKQKRDIFYNNAARFLRLSREEIARHHRM
jgi:predicted TIM-barrel fold metal-dependent hydrolase